MPRLIFLAAAAALLIGCKGGIDQTLEQQVEEIHPLTTGGSLSVKNTDGSIHIFGSDAAELKLKAIKRAYSTERLNSTKVQVSTNSGSASVDTIFPSKPEWWRLGDRSGTVDYILVVPQRLRSVELELVNGEVTVTGLRGSNVKAMLFNGRMSARNCFANVDYRVVNGAIEFYYDWWEGTPFHLMASTGNGGVGAFLPAKASFRVEAKAPNGRIETTLVQPELDIQNRTTELTTAIGSDPKATFQFESTSGNIRIRGF